ncbi:MAG: hypothetical protein GY928_21840 [Colwellia sp.]|nr:hypothetical protein [Colwellia sp.]
MNQVTNLIQWKNLTEDQKAEFDFENYKYEKQVAYNWEVMPNKFTACMDDAVYRLVIEDDKWYTYFSEKFSEKYTVKGSEFTNPDGAICLRPAKPDEIPQQEKTLEQKIQEKWPDKEVVMLTPENGVLRIVKKIGGFEYDRPHIFAQSVKGYHKYVYELLSGKLELNTRPIMPGVLPTLQPVAVLFEE